jgi:hypothetical protein
LEGTAESVFVSYLVRIIYDTLDVYSEPTFKSKIKLQVKKNGIYTIVEEKGNWGKLKSGAGWIHLNGTKKN